MIITPGLSVELHGKTFTMSISEQCHLLGLSRSSYYWWLGHKERLLSCDVELPLVQAILDWWTDHPSTGYQMIARQLQELGHNLQARNVFERS